MSLNVRSDWKFIQFRLDWNSFFCIFYLIGLLWIINGILLPLEYTRHISVTCSDSCYFISHMDTFQKRGVCLPDFVDLLGLRWFHPFFLVFVLFSAVELAKKSNHCIICLSVYTEIFLTSMCCGSRVSRGCLILASIAWNGHNLLQWPYQDRDGPVESEV